MKSSTISNLSFIFFTSHKGFNIQFLKSLLPKGETALFK